MSAQRALHAKALLRLVADYSDGVDVPAYAAADRMHRLSVVFTPGNGSRVDEISAERELNPL